MTEDHDGHRPVRVLALTKGLGPGGAERLLVTFAALGNRRRVELSAAYLLPWKDHLTEPLHDLGVRTTCLDGRRPLDPGWARRLRRLVRDEQIDVVHVHSPLVAAVARVALRTTRRRPALVGTEHNLWTSHRRPTRWANRVTIGLQDSTLAVSEEVTASMPRRVRARTEVVIHGVDQPAIVGRRDERDAARGELGLRPDDLVVVTVANLRANKDYANLLAAASQLIPRHPTLRFLSVGQGPLQQELAARLDALGLGERFRFLGYQADAVRVLVAADVFCLPSRYEGLPIALLEAMAAGLPVVATAVGGVPSVVTEGVEGRLVPAGDPTALADALEELTDASVRDRFGRAAADRAAAFGAQPAVDRHQDLYEAVSRR
jgi:glycosyltransferase involved in cell wall biosynthesis